MSTENNQNTKNEDGMIAELQDLARILSGEVELEKRRKELEKVKAEAIKKQKDVIRKALEDGRMVLDSDGESNKVIQKIQLFEWEAPIRKKYVFSYRNFILIVSFVLIFMLYLAILGHYLLMGALASVLFLIYVGALYDPIIVKHRITTKGVDLNGVSYEWQDLESFYFTRLDNQYFLIIDTILPMNKRLVFLISEKDKSPIFILLQDKLLYKDFKNNKLPLGDRLSFGDYIPLEDI